MTSRLRSVDSPALSRWTNLRFDEIIGTVNTCHTHKVALIIEIAVTIGGLAGSNPFGAGVAALGLVSVFGPLANYASYRSDQIVHQQRTSPFMTLVDHDLSRILDPSDLVVTGYGPI